MNRLTSTTRLHPHCLDIECIPGNWPALVTSLLPKDHVMHPNPELLFFAAFPSWFMGC
jgi:hypothetical protein